VKKLNMSYIFLIFIHTQPHKRESRIICICTWRCCNLYVYWNDAPFFSFV